MEIATSLRVLLLSGNGLMRNYVPIKRLIGITGGKRLMPESENVAGLYVDKDLICQACGYHEDAHSYSGVVPCKRCKTVEMWYDMPRHYCYDCVDYIVDLYETPNMERQ